MVKFLLQRPIAVMMAFAACFVIGVVTYFTLPVSLLPDIAIPQISIHVSSENSSARELENTVVAPLRRQLLQVSGLREIKSETRDGDGIIRIEFEFGTNTDLAFIEVNEKIDAAMNSLPKETERPRAIKASATDIPVLYLNMTLKDDKPYEDTDEVRFLNMCELAENVVKRRIEQLSEVAMADITGVPGRMLQIVPDQEKLSITGITIADIESTLASNNVEPGSMLIRDGYYEYNVRISTLLRTQQDVENIYIRKGERLMQLKDLCKVDIVSQKRQGMSVAGGKRAVTLAIIKQGDENMDAMKAKLKETTDHFATMYPDIDFQVCRNQTELLDYSISNLQENFIIGFLLIFFVAIYFLGDVRSPIVIGLSMAVSVVITFFLFYLFKVSLNIISLSGLILAVGMMIDNSIIVTENISQYREHGYSLRRACAAGTTEVIAPMLSSMLTTVAVFVPLIFMSGIAGAIFMDQAFSIAAGLLVSYIIGIMLLPVLYLLFYRLGIRRKGFLSKGFYKKENKNAWQERFYDDGIHWVFSHKKLSIAMTLAALPLCFFLFSYLEKERMPEIEQNELVMRIDWNENIHVDENHRRINALTKRIDKLVTEHTAYVGIQDYILNDGSELSATEAELYFKTEQSEGIKTLQEELNKVVRKEFPLAVLTFSPPETIFEKLFVTSEADIVAQLHSSNRSLTPELSSLQNVENAIVQQTGIKSEGIALRNQMNIVVNRESLLLYNVSYNEVTRLLRTAFKENKISTLRSFQQYLPISIASEEQSINEILTNTLVQSQADKDGEVSYIPLDRLVKVVPSEDLKSITAGKDSEYIPISFFDIEDAPQLMNDIRMAVRETGGWEVDFSGSFFSNKKMIGELTVILFVSILLMYFILCAQFESFLQPLIVLVEIPIDVAFALASLWLFGHTLNLMSAIGIIVTCGIVVNDSILKIDSINELRKAGTPLMQAIHTAGIRRLRPIVMTSLTTIMAMVPLLFSSDMGSELQRPLAIAMIGSMLLGTLVSLFIIPLIYWFIYRRKESTI
jgi:multidrug efflux pump subunit AcrB